MTSTGPLNTPPSTLRALAATAAAALALTGCSWLSGSDDSGSAAEEADPTVVIDGQVGDWPQRTVVMADGRYLYLRVKPSQEPMTLQAMQGSLRLVMDIDGKGQTGETVLPPSLAASAVPGSGIGADIEIVFSPRTGDGSNRGLAAARLGPGGQRSSVSNGSVGLVFAPTYAGEWYELRIPRDADAMPELRSRPTVSGFFELSAADGSVIGATPMWSAKLPAFEAFDGSSQRIPTAGPDELRVVSYNVLHTQPMKTPEPFAATLQALRPDILLLQEWHDGTVEDLESWLNAYVPSETPWRAVRADNTGVAVASRHPITPIEITTARPEQGMPEFSTTGRPPNLRVVAATVYSPIGPVTAASTHLKCCGSISSPEDATRLAEARAINERMLAALDGTIDRARVIGGDLNLVGSRPPLDLLVAGLDHDGSALDPAEARVLGSNAMYTWRDWDSPFTPGRLDWIAAGDARSTIVRAFVLDTTVLSEASLAAMGLSATDSNASDHLPVVVDVRAKR